MTEKIVACVLFILYIALLNGKKILIVEKMNTFLFHQPPNSSACLSIQERETICCLQGYLEAILLQISIMTITLSFKIIPHFLPEKTL